jgi:hypothetical protein
MREPKVRVMNGLRVRLPGDARRRAAAVETVDRRMALLEARRAPAPQAVPLAAALAPASSSTAEPNPTAGPGRWSAVERAIDEVRRSGSSVLPVTEGTLVLLRPAELAESIGAVRTPHGSQWRDLVTVLRSKASEDAPANAVIYYVEPRSKSARFAYYGSGVADVRRALTEQLRVYSTLRDFGTGDPATTNDVLELMRVLKFRPVLWPWPSGLPMGTPPDVDAMQITLDPEVEAALLKAWSRQHGDAPQA